ncbi:hypothetical protein BOX30_02165 [Leptospirillum ferriphilum]|nr:hypothetical protein LFML04_2499 [Leptospirillum ferriphilum ML-04]OOH71605.1 hypothetical protein BOX24_08850 [Leptospirillum ferriphilum]OOH83763.1 hypothetical protein BOX30_02165 [Leptospirillum ferriphilum]
MKEQCISIPLKSITIWSGIRGNQDLKIFPVMSLKENLLLILRRENVFGYSFLTVFIVWLNLVLLKIPREAFYEVDDSLFLEIIK